MDVTLARLLAGERTEESASTGDRAARHGALVRAAREFESWFVSHWLAEASKPAFGETGLDGGQAGRMYRDEWQRELARCATSGRGLGFADSIVRTVERGTNGAMEKERIR